MIQHRLKRRPELFPEVVLDVPNGAAQVSTDEEPRVFQLSKVLRKHLFGRDRQVSCELSESNGFGPNSAEDALLLFPAIGWWLHLSQNQFGLWAALAIHDTSSVVGAAAKYGPEALAIGTTVKLARALWIVPVSLITATYMSRVAKRDGTSQHQAKVKVPWFIFLFVGASMLSTYLPRFMGTYLDLNRLGKAGLTATLFLIGTSLSKKTLQAVGIKPFLQGVILWIIVGTASLVALYMGLISI